MGIHMKRTSSGTCVPTSPFLTNQNSVSLPKISFEFSLKLSRITGSSKFLKSWDKRGFSKRRWKFVEMPFDLKLHWFRAKVMKFVKICSHFFFTLLLSSWRSFLRVLFFIVTVKPDVLFRATLQTSAAMLVFWLAVCSEQFATGSHNLLAKVANLLV